MAQVEELQPDPRFCRIQWRLERNIPLSEKKGAARERHPALRNCAASRREGQRGSTRNRHRTTSIGAPSGAEADKRRYGAPNGARTSKGQHRAQSERCRVRETTASAKRAVLPPVHQLGLAVASESANEKPPPWFTYRSCARDLQLGGRSGARARRVGARSKWLCWSQKPTSVSV